MKKDDILLLPMEGLRPLVMRALKITAWPGDWNAVGMIHDAHKVNTMVNLLNGAYTAMVWGRHINACAVSKDPLTAVFRAYLVMRWNQAEWDETTGVK